MSCRFLPISFVSSVTQSIFIPIALGFLNLCRAVNTKWMVLLELCLFHILSLISIQKYTYISSESAWRSGWPFAAIEQSLIKSHTSGGPNTSSRSNKIRWNELLWWAARWRWINVREKRRKSQKQRMHPL